MWPVDYVRKKKKKKKKMANVNAVLMQINIPGAIAYIVYNDTNKRILTVNWALPAGVSVHARIWDTDISPINPVYDRSVSGPASGSENVPGNYRMVAHPDGYDEFPPNLRWTFNMEASG